MLKSHAFRSRVALALCTALIASLCPPRLQGQSAPPEGQAELRIAVVQCADLTGESVPGLAMLLERSLWKSLASHPGVAVVQDTREATRLLSAQITSVTRSAKKRGGGQVEILAELADAQTGVVTYRTVVRGGGFSRPGEAATAQIERAVSEGAERIATQVIRSERLRGTIVQIQRGTSATVNLGTDAGLTTGTELEIARGETVVGHLRVDRVAKQEASGLLFDIKPGATVTAGDQVRISSSPRPVLPEPPQPKKDGGNRSWVWVAGALVLGAVAVLAFSGGGGGGVNGGQIYLVATDQQIPANGTSTTTITATVRDRNGNPAKNGTRVDFQTTLGVVAPAHVRTTNGVATATLTSAPTPGTATITARAAGLQQTTTVEFTPAPGPGVAAHISVMADPTVITANGVSTSEITATVTDQQNNPVPDGTLVKFSTSLGIIAPATVLTVGGEARATLRSGRQAGTARVTAKVDQITDTTEVEFVSAVASSLKVKADPEQIPADGSSTSTITATVSDPQHNPVPDGTVVRFTTSLGLISPGTASTSNGVAKATLRSGTNPGTATVTVKVDTLTEQVSVDFLNTTPARLNVTANPKQIPADGTSTSTLTAMVSDAQNNPVPNGTQVTFSTSQGTINPASAKTTNGTATATLTSSMKAGTATVTVKAGTLTRRVKVAFVSTKPAQVKLTANPEEIPADGKSTSTITATVTDAQNNPVPDGTMVTFTTSLGFVSPGTDETQGGRATATLHSGTDPGTATVTVKVGTLTEQIQVVLIDPTPASLTVTANPKQIPADGTSTSTITAVVSDAQSNPVPDATLVTFTTSLGVVGPASASTTNGTATATLTAGTTPGTATVTVKAGTLIRKVDVEFLDLAPASLTVAADPKAIPADDESTSTITASVTDAHNNPVPDGTTVEFSTSLGSISPASALTTGGVATAMLRSGVTPGTATVTVKAGTLARKVTVEFQDTTPAFLTVEADPKAIPADDTSTSTITATVKDALNNPVPDGTTVKFTTSLGTISPASALTTGGVATATLRSGTTPGTATVTVKAGTLTRKVQVEFEDPTPAFVVVGADPLQIPADGTSTSTITVTVSNSRHNPVPDGTVVKLTASRGLIGPATVTTEGGVATATLRSDTTTGPAWVTARVGTLIGKVKVTFTAP